MERPMQYAYEVFRKGSISKAAESLYISQPALSAIIRKLEESIGTQIFDRSTKPLRLTPEGEYYIHCVEQIRSIETDMKQYFEDIEELKKGSLRIGASTYFCSNILPGLMRKFHRDYPYIQVILEENNSTPQLKEILLAKEIDFALTSNTYPTDDFEEVRLFNEVIVLAVPAGREVNRFLLDKAYTFDEMSALSSLSSDLSEVKRISLKMLAQEEFITIDRISDLYPRIQGMFKEYEISPRISMHLQQMSSCYYMAANGFGCAFLRLATLQTVKKSDQLLFYFIDSPRSIRSTQLYYKKGGYITRAMQAFLSWVPSHL
ncbi:MAG: LysR family transcriptional regulator [Blautia sp.]|nr:LysR family transcriptional regulator [Blautia sp.]